MFILKMYAQVSINTTGTAPDPSAMLDISSTSKGVLIPRMTSNQRNAIETSQAGLLVYDTETESFWYYNNTAETWVEIGSESGADWTISGNNIYSSVSGNVGIGTTNPSSKLQIRNGNLSLISQNEDAYIKLSSDEEQDITPAYIWSENAKGFAVGSTAGTPQLLVNAATGKVGIGTPNPNQKLTIRDGNMSLVSEGSDSYIHLGSNELGDAIGTYIWTKDDVGFSVGSTENVPQLVVKNSNGNVGIGTTNPSAKLEVAGQVKITGGNPGANKVLTSDANGLATWSSPTAYATSINDLTDAEADAADLFLGDESGINNDGLNFNTGIGIQALKTNTTGSSNTATGMGALQSNVTGYDNTSNGHLALQQNTTGNANVAIGKEALLQNTTGNANVAIGKEALLQSTTKSNLTAVGYQALYWNGTGSTIAAESSENTAIGSKSLYSNTLGSQNTAIGFESLKTNTQGSQNTAMGTNSLFSNTTGKKNTAFGAFALNDNTTAELNTAMGYQSMYNNTSGDYNTALGAMALYASTTGTHNTALGYTALFNNTSGIRNTALGTKALYTNTEGEYNVAVGDAALYSNTTGDKNIAIGSGALRYNTETNNSIAIGNNALENLGTEGPGINGEWNIAIGAQALQSTISGESNVSIGNYALMHNDYGYDNCAFGDSSLVHNTYGHKNIAMGTQSLSSNTYGDKNIAIGYGALNDNITGSSNIGIGYNAGPTEASFANTICIGSNTHSTASHQIRLGNSYITSIGGQVGWTTLSDGRFKTDISEDVAGLDFILALRPVNYKVDKQALNQYLKINDEDSNDNSNAIKIESGFIAQEVEAAAKAMSFNFSGVDAPNTEDGGYYGLRYGQFVVPLVKGMQEQQQQIVHLEQEIEALKAMVENLLNNKSTE